MPRPRDPFRPVTHLGSRSAAHLGSRSAARLGSRSAAQLSSRPISGLGSEAGQASVELVALLPVLAVLLAGAWQAALAGHALWAATTAAGAAARAHAVGADPAHAARSRLPGSLEHDLRVTTGHDGHVRVTVRIPALPGLPSPGRARAGAHFEPQT